MFIPLEPVLAKKKQKMQQVDFYFYDWLWTTWGADESHLLRTFPVVRKNCIFVY
jgi:hypothetical protein